MKDIYYLQVAFYLNHQLVEAEILPATRAIDLIRAQGFTGTKETCGEGDCGACTIAIGQLVNDQLQYRSVNSCIFPAAKLHGKHIITVEGLMQAGKLHLIQQMLLDSHATQCGYCTPGMVMSLFALFANNPKPEKEAVFAALEGNLCRCTGYQTIYDAAIAVSKALEEYSPDWRSLIFPDYVVDMPPKIKALHTLRYLSKRAPEIEITEGYFIPKTFAELFSLMENHQDNFTLILGGTDLIVEANLKDKHALYYIDLSELSELAFIKEQNNKIFIGAGTTYAELFDSDLIQKKLPALCRAIREMASQQIRNVGTLAGNIAHASPVADGVVALLGLGASVVLKSKEAERVIPLEEFFTGYQTTVMNSREIIASIEVPVQTGEGIFIKGAKRVAVDISKICSLIYVELKENKISACRIAFGGVDQYPTIAKKTMKKIINKTLTEKLINEIADSVYDEFKKIIETRSEPEYRKALVKNHVIKSFNTVLTEEE